MKIVKNILVLAGGDGTRFWPLKNKCLFPFLGKSFIQHLLVDTPAYLNLTSYTNQVVIVCPKQNKEEFQNISNVSTWGKPIVVVVQNPDLHGQGGAILSAKNKIKGDVLIINANDIFQPEILDLMHAEWNHSKSELFILATKVEKYIPGGYLKFKENKLVEVVEKPEPGKEPSKYLKMVVDYFSDFSMLVKQLEFLKTDKDDLYEQAINNLLKIAINPNWMNYDTNNLKDKHIWLTVKYPWHILSVMNFFLSKLQNEVVLGKNVKIAKTAKLEGPCFIDDNTVVGDFAMIRQSHIGQNCMIGGYSEVTRSYLGNNVFLHRNYIGDSILADNVMFGAQAATANFRFDEKTVKSKVNETKIDTNLEKFGAIIGEGSKIGVNSTLLPGVKIGSNTLVAPGHTIAEDIGDGKFVKKGIYKNKHIL